MSDGSAHNLALVAEVTRGTIPATPGFQNLRHTSCNLALAKGTQQSGEVRSDRQISDFRHSNKSVTGGFGFELSYGTYDVLLEAALGGTWASDVLKAGSNRRAFTFERYYSDMVAANKPWHRFVGCEVNSLALSLPTEGNITGTFEFLGRDKLFGDSVLTGSSYTAQSTTKVFSSFEGVIQEGGSTLGIVTQLDLTIANNLTAKPVVGSNVGQAPSIGRSNITGTVTAYFESSTLLEKFANEQESSIGLTLTDLDGNSYVITLPRIVYTGGQADVSGEGALVVPLPFQALYHAGSNTNIQISRAAA